jgi:hypothetical protein
MKMLKDYTRNMLQGETEVISATELKKHVGECLTQASLGKSFCIKRKGKIVAFLVSPENADMVHHILPDGSSPTMDLDSKDIKHRDPDGGYLGCMCGRTHDAAGKHDLGCPVRTKWDADVAASDPNEVCNGD